MNRLRAALAPFNCDGGAGLLLAAVCLLLLLLAATGEEGRALLRYDRMGLAQGQWWRLVTAHLVHLDLWHAVLNSLGLALMWTLFAGDYSPRQWLLLLLAAVAAIDAGLWLADSTVLWYVGSSGVLHGVMAAGTMAQLRRRERDGWILAAILVVKLIYEQRIGALPFAGSDPVIVNAHLYGVLGAGAVAVFLRPRRLPL